MIFYRDKKMQASLKCLHFCFKMYAGFLPGLYSTTTFLVTVPFSLFILMK